MTSMPDTPLREEALNRRRLLMERSRPGRTGVTLPASDVPPQLMPEQAMLRDDLQLPEVTEGEVVRYFTHLSQLNFSIDTNFYPLGSCTMKYNPKLNEAVAATPGFALAHPAQPERQVQGTLEAVFRLQTYLQEVSGLPSASLAPLAGAQGELAGVLTLRAALDARGEGHRSKMISDTAHGTKIPRPHMAGSAISVPHLRRANIDPTPSAPRATKTSQALMFKRTTLGLFRRNANRDVSPSFRGRAASSRRRREHDALLGRAKSPLRLRLRQHEPAQDLTRPTVAAARPGHLRDRSAGPLPPAPSSCSGRRSYGTRCRAEHRAIARRRGTSAS